MRTGRCGSARWLTTAGEVAGTEGADPERAAAHVVVRVLEKLDQSGRDLLGESAEQSLDPLRHRVAREPGEQHRLQLGDAGRRDHRGGRAEQAVALVHVALTRRRLQQLAQVGDEIPAVHHHVALHPAQERLGIGMQLDRHRHREEQRVAQRSLAHREQERQERLQRFRRGDPAERLHRRLREDRIRHERHQRPHRIRVTDVPQRGDGRELEPEVALEETAEQRHRLLDAQLAGRLDCRLGDVGIRMVEQGEDRRGGRGVADAGKALEREQQQLGILAPEHADQMRHGIRALALECAEPGVPPHGVLAVGHQRAEDGRLEVARGELDRALAHAGRRVLQRGQDGAFAARLAGSRLQRGDPLRRRERGSGHTCSRETRCFRASDSPARLLAAPLICSTATRFCRETTAIASTAFTTISPPCFCSVTASDIWWVS